MGDLGDAFEEAYKTRGREETPENSAEYDGNAHRLVGRNGPTWLAIGVGILALGYSVIYGCSNKAESSNLEIISPSKLEHTIHDTQDK